VIKAFIAMAGRGHRILPSVTGPHEIEYFKPRLLALACKRSAGSILLLQRDLTGVAQVGELRWEGPGSAMGRLLNRIRTRRHVPHGVRPALSGDADWRHPYGVNRSVNINNINTNNWTHNPAHRQGVRYNNANVAAKFGNRTDIAGDAQNRMDFQG
jgi:hypothetical protein